MARIKQDDVGEKCIRNNHGDLVLGDSAKEVWKNYYSRLLNEEFELVKVGLSFADPAVRIERKWAKMTISNMKSGKAAIRYCIINVEDF